MGHDGGDRYRAVVAIDIDGVLRLRRGKVVRAERRGAFAAEVTVHRDAYPKVFHSPPDWDDDGISTSRYLFSGVGAAWARSLLDRGVELVWATTWQRHANTYFAPILGIPPLPVAVHGEEEEEWGPAEWKSVQLAEGFAGRPLLWVDDMPPMWPGYQLDVLRTPRDRALPRLQWIRDPAIGITLEDVAEMDEWLMLTTTETGHVELRRRRRRERDRERDEGDTLRFGSRARGRLHRRTRAKLYDAIGRADFTAADVSATYLLQHDPPDLTALRELADQWFQDETRVQAILNVVAQFYLPEPPRASVERLR